MKNLLIMVFSVLCVLCVSCSASDLVKRISVDTGQLVCVEGLNYIRYAGMPNEGVFSIADGLRDNSCNVYYPVNVGVFMYRKNKCTVISVDAWKLVLDVEVNR